MTPRILTISWNYRAMSMLLILGCESVPEAPSYIVRDSANVQIVESLRPAFDSSSAPTLSPDPILAIGAVEGDSSYLFHGILGVRQLSDGRFVVANVGTSELRFYDVEGRFITSVGGEGDGPGEFRFMSLFWTRAGDTILVSDLHGLTVLDPDGRYVRRIQPRSGDGTGQAPAIGQIIGQLDDGTLVSTAPTVQSPPVAGQLAQSAQAFRRLAADGSYAGDLTVLPSADRWPVDVGGGRTMPRRVPFSSYPAWAATGTQIYLTSGREPMIQVWDADGSLERIIRWSLPSLALSDEYVAQYRRHLLASTSNPAMQQQHERFLAEVAMPEQIPATGEGSGILVDSEGAMWVQAYRLPWDETSTWFVFGREGEWLGSVRMPARFTPHQLDRNTVVGSYRDELGVEYVHAYATSGLRLRN